MKRGYYKDKDMILKVKNDRQFEMTEKLASLRTFLHQSGRLQKD